MLRSIIKISVIVLKIAAADSDFWITNRFLSPSALNASLIYRSQLLDPRGSRNSHREFVRSTQLPAGLRRRPFVWF
jgi:hypothetical protein